MVSVESTIGFYIVLLHTHDLVQHVPPPLCFLQTGSWIKSLGQIRVPSLWPHCRWGCVLPSEDTCYLGFALFVVNNYWCLIIGLFPAPGVRKREYSNRNTSLSFVSCSDFIKSLLLLPTPRLTSSSVYEKVNKFLILPLDIVFKTMNCFTVILRRRLVYWFTF